MVTLNETPVRTARNFNINNIKIEKICSPSITEKFQNTKITGANVAENTSTCNFKYGIGAELIDEINKNANTKISLSLKEKQNNIQIEHTLDNQNPTLIENIEITANEQTISNIVIKYKQKEEIKRLS